MGLTTEKEARAELVADMLAQLRELHTMELANVISLRMSARIVHGEDASLGSACLAACADVALRRHAQLSNRLAEIDVEPSWHPTALRGLADRLAEALAKDRSVEGLASRALVETLALLCRYQELVRTAENVRDRETRILLETLVTNGERQAAALARLLEQTPRTVVRRPPHHRVVKRARRNKRRGMSDVA